MRNPEHEPLASALTAARERRKMTQAELAEASGVSPSTICRVEKAERGLGAKLALKLARALRIPIEALIDPPKKRPRRAA